MVSRGAFYDSRRRPREETLIAERVGRFKLFVRAAPRNPDPDGGAQPPRSLLETVCTTRKGDEIRNPNIKILNKFKFSKSK